MVVVVVVDSHIQRIVLATEETTVTQQVSHRPIKCESRLWSQRGTKVNVSHHGANPLLRPTGIQIATKRGAALQAMTSTNIKTVVKPPYSISRATSIDSECCRLPTTSVLSKKTEKLRKNYAPTSFDQQVQDSQGHTLYRNKKKRNTEVHGGSRGLELVEPASKPASSRPKPCASLKKPHESCPFAAPCGPRRKKNDDRPWSDISFSIRNLPVQVCDSRAQGFSPPLARRRSSCPPPSPHLVRTHPIENYRALRDSAPCLSRAATLPKGTKLGLGRGAHLGTPSSSANHTAAASQPTG